MTISSVEAPAAGTKRPHKFTDTTGQEYKTFDPAIADAIRARVLLPVQLEVETKPGKPGYPADIFITRFVGEAVVVDRSQPASAAPPAVAAPARTNDPALHADARRLALQCATDLAAAKLIGVDKLTETADLLLAWILEKPSATRLVPLHPDEAAATIAPKGVGRAVALDLLSKIVAAGRLAPETRRADFYGRWLKERGYATYGDFQMFGHEHAQAALDFLARGDATT